MWGKIKQDPALEEFQGVDNPLHNSCQMGNKSLREEQRESYWVQSRGPPFQLYSEFCTRSTWRHLEGWQTCQGLGSSPDTHSSREHPWPQSAGWDASWILCTLTSWWGSGMNRDRHTPVVLGWKMYRAPVCNLSKTKNQAHLVPDRKNRKFMGLGPFPK